MITYRWRVLKDSVNPGLQRMLGKVLPHPMTESDALGHQKATGRVLEKIEHSSSDTMQPRQKRQTGLP